jgi:hypothetical protein
LLSPPMYGREQVLAAAGSIHSNLSMTP